MKGLRIEITILIISNEFQMLYNYNSIERIKTRINSPESIIKKVIHLLIQVWGIT